MKFDHQQFSRFMKTVLADYLSGVQVRGEVSNKWIDELSIFDLQSLSDDDLKKAFWVNVYNGLTNYFIISRGLEKSVWEVPDFFTALTVNIGGEDFSLDDIEHGILRKNGERKKGKPVQFSEGNSKRKWMVNRFDPRIHFALNCGSVSCPPIAFYSAENIGQELGLAEAGFVSQEFIVDHLNKEIRCSEIFIWYQKDFPGKYLESPALNGYRVRPVPYQWTIH